MCQSVTSEMSEAELPIKMPLSQDVRASLCKYIQQPWITTIVHVHKGLSGHCFTGHVLPFPLFMVQMHDSFNSRALML